jgi:hypothetical protein
MIVRDVCIIQSEAFQKHVHWNSDVHPSQLVSFSFFVVTEVLRKVDALFSEFYRMSAVNVDPTYIRGQKSSVKETNRPTALPRSDLFGSALSSVHIAA